MLFTKTRMNKELPWQIEQQIKRCILPNALLI